MSIAGLLKLRASVRRAAFVDDASGDAVAVWDEIARDVPCAVEAGVERGHIDAGGTVGIVRARIFFDADADVRDADAAGSDPAGRPLPGDRVKAGGILWAVLSGRVETGARAAVRVADVVRVVD